MIQSWFELVSTTLEKPFVLGLCVAPAVPVMPLPAIRPGGWGSHWNLEYAQGEIGVYSVGACTVDSNLSETGSWKGASIRDFESEAEGM